MLSISGTRKRAIAIGAAWAAAYALVFQIFCAGLLLASISPASADFVAPLCVTGIHSLDSSASPEQPVAKTGLYCPLCTVHFFGNAVLPEAPTLFRAAAVPAPAAPAFAPQATTFTQVYDERARDPPCRI
jgi:hypothetical protein